MPVHNYSQNGAYDYSAYSGNQNGQWLTPAYTPVPARTGQSSNRLSVYSDLRSPSDPNDHASQLEDGTYYLPVAPRQSSITRSLSTGSNYELDHSSEQISSLRTLFRSESCLQCSDQTKYEDYYKGVIVLSFQQSLQYKLDSNELAVNGVPLAPGKYIFVMTKNFEVYAAPEHEYSAGSSGGDLKHPSFVGYDNILMAGTFNVESNMLGTNIKISKFTGSSGHFLPTAERVRLGFEAFKIKFASQISSNASVQHIEYREIWNNV